METKLKKGDFKFMFSENLLALKWCDRREVWMLSTCHSAEMIETGKKDRITGEVARKPKCVSDYNCYMGAVDKTDMMLSSIESVRKSVKWYKKFFFHMVDLVLLKAHSLFTLVKKEEMPLEKFHLALIRELLETYHKKECKKSNGRRSNDNIIRLSEKHFPTSVAVHPVTKKLLCRRCVVCSKNAKRQESRYIFLECDVRL